MEAAVRDLRDLVQLQGLVVQLGLVARGVLAVLDVVALDALDVLVAGLGIGCECVLAENGWTHDSGAEGWLDCSGQDVETGLLPHLREQDVVGPAGWLLGFAYNGVVLLAGLAGCSLQESFGTLPAADADLFLDFGVEGLLLSTAESWLLLDSSEQDMVVHVALGKQFAAPALAGCWLWERFGLYEEDSGAHQGSLRSAESGSLFELCEQDVVAPAD